MKMALSHSEEEVTAAGLSLHWSTAQLSDTCPCSPDPIPAAFVYPPMYAYCARSCLGGCA